MPPSSCMLRYYMNCVKLPAIKQRNYIQSTVLVEDMRCVVLLRFLCTVNICYVQLEANESVRLLIKGETRATA